MTTLRRYGWTYREVAGVLLCNAGGVLLDVTRPDGRGYRTVVDCDVWLDAVEDGAHLFALPVLGVRQMNVRYCVMSLPDATRRVL